MKYLTPARRRWIYGIAAAFVPLAVTLGWIDVKAAALVLPLVMALLNVSDDA